MTDDPDLEDFARISDALDSNAVPWCGSCHETRTVIPMGDRWAFESVHEGDCPQHEDNQPALEVDLDEYEAGLDVAFRYRSNE